MLAEHKHGGGTRPWHVYTEVQIERAHELAKLLVDYYGLQDVLGHEDIARVRMQDPGPAFPLASIAGRALDRNGPAIAVQRGAVKFGVMHKAPKKKTRARTRSTLVRR